MNTNKLKSISTNEYITDMQDNPIMVGDIVVTCHNNNLLIVTVKKILTQSGNYRDSNNTLRYGGNSLNISKMHSSEILKANEEEIKKSIIQDNKEKENKKIESTKTKWVLTVCIKSKTDFGLCYFKIQNDSGVTTHDVMNILSQYIINHPNEKLFVLTKDNVFVPYNDTIQDIKLSNWSSVLCGNNRDLIQYCHTSSPEEFNKLDRYTTWYQPSEYKGPNYYFIFNKYGDKNEYTDGWFFRLTHVGYSAEAMKKLINSYTEIIKANV